MSDYGRNRGGGRTSPPTTRRRYVLRLECVLNETFSGLCYTIVREAIDRRTRDFCENSKTFSHYRFPRGYAFRFLWPDDNNFDCARRRFRCRMSTTTKTATATGVVLLHYCRGSDTTVGGTLRGTMWIYGVDVKEREKERERASRIRGETIPEARRPFDQYARDPLMSSLRLAGSCMHAHIYTHTRAWRRIIGLSAVTKPCTVRRERRVCGGSR